SIVAEIKKVADAGKNVVVLIDDAYFGLVYEDKVFTESIFVELANLSERVLAVKLDGPTKEDYVWGFRAGFVSYAIKGGTAELYEALENKTAGAVRGNISNISNLSQSLLYKVYTSASYEDSKKQKFEILKSRYNILRNELNKPGYSEYFEALPFNSGYFMCITLKKGLVAEEVRKHLLEKYSTGVIVLGSVIRLAFSSVPAEKIPVLVENIYKACKDLAK
ncbi:MAG TPA: aminotransferase class I/II-fold pyridoxal phosphate-dependent enzyme, partial [Bacteroidales bacterium]|nr:aminotransferase class I/II-fold pyridoxal phosphate-dependent enzyme [Bacteroidales bacterium]